MTDSAPTWAEFMEGWQLGLYKPPLLCAAAAGAALGFLSGYVVLRRMVFVSAAVTQAAGLGVALSLFAGIHLGVSVDPGVGAVVLSLVTAGALVVNPGRTGLTREMVLGLAFALTGGAAILVGSRITQEAHDIQAILFGTAVVVDDIDFRNVLAVGAGVLTLHLWWFRGLSFASFDPVTARVHGLPVVLLDAVLLLSIGVMVGVSARALGALPVFALSTLPAMAAVQLARGHLLATFALASALGAAAGAAGYLVAFFGEFPVGSTVTVLLVALVAAAAVARAVGLALARLRGAVSGRGVSGDP